MQTTCPRCGYDLQGVMATWTESCPVNGQCSECGLTFQWARLLTTRFVPPLWSIEHARLWRLPRALFRSHFVGMRPRRFWTDLRMTHPVRSGRLGALLALQILVVYFFFVLAAGKLMYIERESTPDVWDSVAAVMLNPFDSNEAFYSEREYTQSLLYGFTPYRDITAWRFFKNSLSDVAVLALGVVLHAWISVAGFLLLPVSRRKAKVRWAHLFRIGVLSSRWVVPTAIAVLSLRVLGWEGYGIVLWPALGLGLYSLFWWTCAIRRYLRMEHARSLAFLLWAMSLLALAVLAFTQLRLTKLLA